MIDELMITMYRRTYTVIAVAGNRKGAENSTGLNTANIYVIFVLYSEIKVAV